MPTASDRRRKVLLVVLASLVACLALGYRELDVIPLAIARHRIEQQEFEHGLWWLDWANWISPENARVEFLYARICRKKGEMREVGIHLQRAVDFGFPLELADREQWLALAQSGQMREAETHYRVLLTDARGDEAEICEAFVIGYCKLRQFEKAVQLLRAWSADLPTDPLPHYYWGLIEQESKSWDEAIRHYEQALRLNPKYSPAALAIATCFLETKHPQEALDYYQVATQDPRHSTTAMVGEAHCLRELGRSDEARAILARALASDPDDSRAILEMSNVELEAAEFKAALSRLESLVEREPHNLDARFAYATALRGTFRTDEAKEQLEIVSEARKQLVKAVNLAGEMKSPNDVDTRYEIGAIHLKYGEPTEGLFWLTSVLEYDPKHLPTHRTLAEYYAMRASDDPQYASLAKRHLELSQNEGGL